MQKNLDDIEWEEINPNNEDEETEFLKLNEKEQFIGLLLDKYPSRKYKGKHIYKLQKPHDQIPKIMIGTTMLDIMMRHVEIGSPVRIKRLPDKEQKDKPNDLQQYLVEIPKGAGKNNED